MRQHDMSAVPNIEVKIGKYLYFRGVTSFQSIFRALKWQREQRPSIGVLVRERIMHNTLVTKTRR